MNWGETLQKKQGKLAQAVAFIKRNLPKWKVVGAEPDRAHGGIIRYTESEPSEQHDPANEPHQISLPSSPRVKWKAWLKQQLADVLESNARGVGVEGQMRSRFRNQGGYKLASDNKERSNWFSVLKTPPPFPKPWENKLGYYYDELKPNTQRQVDAHWEQNELPEEMKQRRVWATTNKHEVGKAGLRLEGYDPSNAKDMKTLKGVMGRLRALEMGESKDKVFPANQLNKDLRAIFNDRLAQDKDWATKQVRKKIRAFDNKDFKFSTQTLAILRQNDAEIDVIRFVEDKMR